MTSFSVASCSTFFTVASSLQEHIVLVLCHQLSFHLPEYVETHVWPAPWLFLSNVGSVHGVTETLSDRLLLRCAVFEQGCVIHSNAYM